MKFFAFAQYFIAVILFLLAPTANLLAQGLLITDCHGFTRALHQASSGELNTVNVSVSSTSGSPLNGAQVTLTNSVTGEVSTAVSQNGVAVFEGISQGTFSVATTASNAAIGTVSITGGVVGTTAAVGAVAAAGGAAGGGAVVVGKKIDDEFIDNSKEDTSSSGGGDTQDPGVNPTTAPTPRPTARPTPQRPPATPRPTPECDDCDPDEEPPPLDDNDFFRKQQRLLSPSS